MDATRGKITTAKQLAKQMASAAAKLTGNESPLTDDLRARLDPALVHEIERLQGNAGQPDTLAQLIVFGMLVAACDGSHGNVPPSTFSDPGANLIQLLDAANLPRILNDLERRFRTSDAIGHLYETFLSEHDALQRRRRGVYYTPAPIVSYLIRSVHGLLRSHFHFSEGLCDSARSQGDASLQIVDPACGTGIFLSAVIDFVRGRCGGECPFDEQAKRFLRRSLAGFEVLPASCAVARWLLGRKLAASPGEPDSNLNIQPINPLERAEHAASLLNGPNKPSVVVVIGNPPYANFGRQNQGAWIHGLLKDYKHGVTERKHNLHDDFIKFIRWSQYLVDRAGAGIVALVTNNTYLAGLTHRGMRRSLCHTFDDLFVLDLHGSSKKREIGPGGLKDENVFDIQQGVALGIFVKSPKSRRAARLRHAELWGSRDDKFRFLENHDTSTTTWTDLEPRPENFLLVPCSTRSCDEYFGWPRLDEVFRELISGVQTKRDALFVGRTKAEVERRMRVLLDPDGRQREQAQCGVLRAEDRWIVERARGLKFSAAKIRPLAVAPWDLRFVYYEPRLLGRARYSVMRHMLDDNVGLVFMRQSTGPGQYDQFLAVRTLVTDRVFYSGHGAPYLAPLCLHNDQRETNFESAFLQDFAKRLGLRFVDPCHGDLSRTVGSLDVFNYVYGIFFSRKFRERYAEPLKAGFPRVPLTSSKRLFRRLSRLGGCCVRLHLMQNAERRFQQDRFPATGDHLIQRGFPKFAAPGCSGESRNSTLAAHPDSGRLYISPKQYFEGISPRSFEFRLGGYPVLKRWLVQRRESCLSEQDIRHFASVADAVDETIDLTRKIDAAIDRWPIC